MAVEKSYFDMLDNLLAERVNLIQQLSEVFVAVVLLFCFARS